MNTKEAIKILKERVSYIHTIEKDGKNFVVYYKAWIIESDVYSARQLIKWAKSYTSENNQNTASKRNVKKFDNGKNRTATRDAIKSENFDKIPQRGKVAMDDIWSWD